MTENIPLVDLAAQYRAIQPELDAAFAQVIADSAFIGTSSNRFVRAFEEQFAAFVGREACVACGNGTDALEIVLKAAGIGPGDEVLVPALSWIASSEAVSSCGATPVFVDIVPGRYTMDPAAAAAKVTSRTKAIVPVHLYGLPAEMQEIAGIAERHGLFLLEDCAQAHGAMYRGRQVGTLGHAATYSFFPSKNLGAWGDAGAVVTNDAQLARSVRMIAQHGQSGRKHDHEIEGRNSRMDGLQAAVLSVKLAHLVEWTQTRRAIAARYRDSLQGIVEGVQIVPPDTEPVYHLFVVEVVQREAVQAALGEQGIATAVQYPVPLPLLRPYAHGNHTAADFPVACSVASRVLSLPMYPEMTKAQQDRIIAALAKIAAAV